MKLYDLTTLCADYMEDRNANPFTVPVGILLYRVARNMRQTMGRKKSATIRTLLENSLHLLDNTLYSQASSCFFWPAVHFSSVTLSLCALNGKKTMRIKGQSYRTTAS